MTKKDLNLIDAFTLEPKIFNDERGYFFESYKSSDFSEIKWVQENESLSTEKNIIRGLHLQHGEHAQSKLLRVVSGAIVDVIVDLRENSETFMQHQCVALDDKSKKMIFVPKGFAHGFITKTENVIVQYKVDNIYHKDSERTIKWNDKDLNIDWKQSSNPILSEKDINGISVEEYLNG